MAGQEQQNQNILLGTIALKSECRKIFTPFWGTFIKRQQTKNIKELYTGSQLDEVE